VKFLPAGRNFLPIWAAVLTLSVLYITLIYREGLKMQLSYTFWAAKEGGYVGYINQYPDYWTQGGDIRELEEMLASLYSDIMKLYRDITK